MGKHHDTKANIAYRIAAVARLKLRYGCSTRQITEALAGDPECHNPQTGKPWGLATIKRDLQGLAEQWRQDAQQHFAILRAEQLAALREVRGAAWDKDDHTAALQALKAEIALTGTQAPRKVLKATARTEERVLGIEEARKELALMLGVEPEQLPPS